MVSREEVRWAYVMLLGREPESEEAYRCHTEHENVMALRASFLGCEEGLSRIRRDIRIAVEQLPFNYYRPIIIHLHIEKTGGTSLYECLAVHFDQTSITLPHTTHIQTYSLGELNQFDFVSGHLTLGEAMSLPRYPKIIISLFREPYARLISFYRFHRAHPYRMRHDPMVQLAQDCDPVEFFTNAEVRSSHRLFNAYVRQLVGLPDEPTDWRPEVMACATREAIDKLASLAVVGITENFTGALAQVNSATGLAIEQLECRLHSTNTISQQEGFCRVPEVSLTSNLKEAIYPLIEFDLMVYEQAKNIAAARS